jgi:hypothetical protein
MWRHAGTVVICAALVAGVIVAALYTGSGAHGHSAGHDVVKRHDVHEKYAPLLAAVTTTTDSSSFDFTFTESDNPGTQSGSGGPGADLRRERRRQHQPVRDAVEVRFRQ